MSRRKKQPDPEPVLIGESWRSQMNDECESVASLVWKRVHKRHGVDLADRRQATALQVFTLLEPLQGFERITADMLAELIDRRVKTVFAGSE